MSREFYILLAAMPLVWLLLTWLSNTFGPRWFLGSAMARAVTATEDTYIRMDRTIKLLQEQIADRDRQLEKMQANSARRDEEIGQLKEELRVVKEQLQAEKKAMEQLRQELERKEVLEAADPPVPSVLLVAPDSDLPLVQAEAQDILRSGLTVTPLFSPITQLSLIRELRGSKTDGLWLAGHMAANGDFPLDNGQILPASALVSLVRGRYAWVYLNACQSILAAQQLQNETGADVICTILDVLDEDAYRTGSLFASALAQLRDPRAAYDESLPGGNRVFVYLAGRRRL